MDAIWAGLFGAAIGAIATFLGSWYGAERGAEKNAILQAKQKEYIATKGLYNSLVMTISIYQGLIDPKVPKDSVMFRKIIFDPEWTKQLAQIGWLSQEDNTTILEWYSYFDTIETNFSIREGPLTPSDLEIAFNSNTTEIEKVTKTIELWLENFSKR